MAPQFIYVMKALRKVVPPSRIILDDIWLSFYPGAKIGVLGPNGAGKSSLLRIMAGGGTGISGEAGGGQRTPLRLPPPGPPLRSPQSGQGDSRAGPQTQRGNTPP